jgi:hypothetical protein
MILNPKVAFGLFYSVLLTKKSKAVYKLWKNILHLGIDYGTEWEKGE